MSTSESNERKTNAVVGQESSIASRLFDVIAAPGEVFSEVRDSPYRHGNWLWPGLLLAVVGIVGAVLVLSQPAIRQQINDFASEQIDKRAAITPMDDQQRTIAEGFVQTMTKVSLVIDPLVTAFAMPFWWGLVIWLVGSKLFKGDYGYLKAVEVAGLVNVVAALELAVRVFLQIGFGSIVAGPHLGMFVGDFDPTKPLHGALASLNLFSLWALVLRGYGMSKIGGFSAVKAVISLAVLWFLFIGGGIAIGATTQRVTGR